MIYVLAVIKFEVIRLTCMINGLAQADIVVIMSIRVSQTVIHMLCNQLPRQNSAHC